MLLQEFNFLAVVLVCAVFSRWKSVPPKVFFGFLRVIGKGDFVAMENPATLREDNSLIVPIFVKSVSNRWGVFGNRFWLWAQAVIESDELIFLMHPGKFLLDTAQAELPHRFSQ